jgi:hypothetical protein
MQQMIHIDNAMNHLIRAASPVPRLSRKQPCGLSLIDRAKRRHPRTRGEEQHDRRPYRNRRRRWRSL